MRHWLTRMVWGLWVGLFLVCGCTEPPPEPTPCKALVDCLDGKICNGGTCGNCSDDASCGKGRLCQGGLCRIGCKDDAGCEAGKRCLDGACVGSCEVLMNCAAGEVCSQGKCQPGCATRADCQGDLYCNVTEKACQECLRDDQCKAGFRCAKGACVCPTENQCAANTCVDLLTDNFNCGRCGVQCKLGTCRSGSCQMSAKQVALGGTHTCALTTVDDVRCWGANDNGELGDRVRVSQEAPVLAQGVSDVTALSLLGRALESGDSSTCALHNDGTVSCWGSNSHGELGKGNSTSTLEPVPITGLNNIIQITSGKGTQVEGEAAGYHRCALDNTGTVHCWGSNNFGEIGDTTKQTRNTPTKVSTIKDVIQVAAGGGHTCAVVRTGGVWCWGNNLEGQLGIKGPATQTSAPIDLPDISDATSVALGVYHSCALRKSGEVKCWGRNVEKQLGDGTIISRRTPVAVKGVTDVIALSAGLWHTCALQRAGTVLCWGRNKFGTIGKGTLLDELLPPTKLGFKDIVQLAVGQVHTCVVSKANVASCWGQGSLGRLGNRSSQTTGVPVIVSEE